MDIKGFLGLRPKADTAAALRQSLAETTAAIETARQRIEALEAQSGVILLDATPDEAERHEATIAAERQQLRRLTAMAAELPTRITAAEQREATAALDRDRDAAEREAARIAKLVPEAEAAFLSALRLVQEIDAGTARVRDVNRRLGEAGRHGDRVTLPLTRAWPNVIENSHVSRPVTLGELLTVPGPRGACTKLAQLEAELARAKAAPLSNIAA